MSDAYRPRTTVDDSQFQGIISIYSTSRTVAQEMPLPSVGDAVTAAWGDYAGHIIIARGSAPLSNGQKSIWIQHLPAPATLTAQDSYNMARTGDGTISRFYVMKRADYGTPAYISARPAVGTEDPSNSRYKFATERVSKIGTDPNSIFIALERIYLLSPRISRYYDDDLEAEVLRTTTVIPAGSGSASSGNGVTVEIQDRDDLYDLQITDSIRTITIISGVPTLTPFTYPRQLSSVPSDSSYPLPNLLRSASIESAYAFANSEEAAFAYDEAWYFQWDIVQPAPGPYETRIHRFLVTDPDDLISSFPIETPPPTQREVIGIARWWAHASDNGNSAFAEAREEIVPETIHGEIEIENVQALSDGLYVSTLPETQGFSEFVRKRSMIIGYEPLRTRHGLYEIRITELNLTGIYGGSKVPLADTSTPNPDTGGTAPPPNVLRPEAPTASVSADNLTVTGSTYPNSQVTVTYLEDVVGRAISSADGTYTVTLTQFFTDEVTLSVVVRYTGRNSYPTQVQTYDITPLAPLATITSDGITLTGNTDPGATVAFSRPAIIGTAQVETATVAGGATATADVIVTVTGAGITGSPLAVNVTVDNLDDADTVAGKIRAALGATAAITALYSVTGTGPDIVLTEITLNGNDPTLNIAIDGTTNSTGVPDAASSANTTTGVATIPAAQITLTADSLGDFSYTFSPALLVGDTISITATDAGGTSPATSLTVSATPPTLTSATFDDSNTISGVATGGTLQVETATVVAPSGITGNGDLVVEVVSNFFSVTLTIPVTTTAHTSEALIADAIEAAINGNATIAARYTATSPGSDVVLTAVNATQDDDGLNIEIGATGTTAAGVTPDATSVDTTAGRGIRVVAYLDNTEIGADLTDVAGTFEITLATALYHGESVRVVAAEEGNESVRSEPQTITAPDLNLEKPVVTYTSAGWIGTKPAGSTSIVYRIATEALPEVVVTPFANGNFAFNLPTYGGEQYTVVARYPAGDSDPIFINAPEVPMPPTIIYPVACASGIPSGYFDNPTFGLYAYMNGLIGQEQSTFTQWAARAAESGDDGIFIFVHYVPGVTVTFDFPGQSLNQIIHSPGSANYSPHYRYRMGVAPLAGISSSSPPTLMNVTATYPDGRVVTASFDRASMRFKYVTRLL